MEGLKLLEKMQPLFVFFLIHIYFYLVTHFIMASSTAFDRSPFFPPNLSIVLNLSFFFNSSESATLIRPILITNHTNFYCLYFFYKPQRLDVFPISKLSYVNYPFYFYHQFLFTFLLIHISYYMLTNL